MIAEHDLNNCLISATAAECEQPGDEAASGVNTQHDATDSVGSTNQQQPGLSSSISCS